jgi:hypothetical protein
MQEPDDDVELELLDTEFGDDITVAYALDDHSGHTGSGCLVSAIWVVMLLAILLFTLDVSWG